MTALVVATAPMAIVLFMGARADSWQPVGLGTVLLRRREIGPFLREFSLHGTHHAPQIRAKLSSISHSPRYGRPRPTGCCRLGAILVAWSRTHLTGAIIDVIFMTSIMGRGSM